jgi:2-polyprenyl-6-methoxyphenol hydroxylase-like FAD-dependent oxidoreductase
MGAFVANIPVLVVGAGPVGLALAGDLGWRGVACTVLERGDGTIAQPRMDMVGMRTMEFARRWGIVDWVENSPYPRDYPQDNAYVSALTGFEFEREPFPSMADAVNLPQTPQRRERCPQNMFDPILTRFALAQESVAIRYRSEVVGITQHQDAVQVSVKSRDTGEIEVLTASYVVGCDGGDSGIRQLLGIQRSGSAALTYTTNVIFRCPDLEELHDKRKAYRFICIGPEGTYATIVAINGKDNWRMSIIGDGTPRRLSDRDIHAAIRRAAGVDFDYEILSVMHWVRSELIADEYGRGRVFLAGDAVHVMSPTGGFGMNTGIGDAVDLSWKLDAVLSGWGGPRLLDSYQAERRAVGIRNAAEATANLRNMLSPRTTPPPPEAFEPGPAGDAARAEFGRNFKELMTREWYAVGIHLGYRYEASPVCWDEGDPVPDNPVASYEQSTRPGGRAPHVWLADGSSTLDLFGRGFILLRSGDDPPLGAGLAAAAAEQGVPLRVVRPPGVAVAEAYQYRLVLVRPDGHVAWRGDADPDDPAAIIALVRGAVDADDEAADSGRALASAGRAEGETA